VHRFLKILLTAALLTAVLQPARAAGHSVPDGAHAVRGWNEVTMATVVAAGTPAAEQPLYLAYVHRAVYDGVLRAAGRRDASVPAAVAAAAHTVLTTHFPGQRTPLDQAYAASLAAVPEGQARRAGVAAGRAAAGAVLRDRAGDGRNGTVLPVPPPGPGRWIPTPPNQVGVSSWLGAMRPFVLRSPGQFRPARPAALTSARWAADYNETRLFGSATSTVRTAEQTEVARFWGDAPVVQIQRALRGYTVHKRLGAAGTARLFALADTASADALIACWDAKYRYEFWRPFSAIPAGHTDGNPATPADPGWQPLLPTPNHPEYPSAHGCTTTAIVTVLAGLDPAHRVDLDVDSIPTGTTRHFTSVPQLVQELANARVWGGLHWRFSTREGSRIGRSVGLAVLAGADRHRHR
jgi:hypothetical protein